MITAVAMERKSKRQVLSKVSQHECKGKLIISYNMNFKKQSFVILSLSLSLFCLILFQKNTEKYFGDVNGGEMRKYIPNLYFSIWRKVIQNEMNTYKNKDRKGKKFLFE